MKPTTTTTTTTTLQSLENDFWPNPPEDSTNLIKTCHTLRKKPLNEMTIENLRVMIGQDIGLKYLVPIAMENLRTDILAAGDFYPGDLLESVLRLDKAFWESNPEMKMEMDLILADNDDVLESEKSLRKSVGEFLEKEKNI